MQQQMRWERDAPYSSPRLLFQFFGMENACIFKLLSGLDLETYTKESLGLAAADQHDICESCHSEKTQKLFFFNHVDSTLNFHNSDQLLSVSRSNFFLLSMAFRLLKKLLPELLFKYWENCLFQPLGNALPSYSQLFFFLGKETRKTKSIRELYKNTKHRKAMTVCSLATMRSRAVPRISWTFLWQSLRQKWGLPQ